MMLITTALMIGTPSLAGVGLLWLRKRTQARMAESKTKLSVQLDVKEYNRIRVWADKNGMTLSEFVRVTLLNSIPIEEQRKLSGAEETGSVMDRVYEELDKADAESPYAGVFPMPPARRPQVGVVNEADRTHPAQRVNKTTLDQAVSHVPPGPHPCVHLGAGSPSYIAGQCQGTCGQVQQRGKPCFWTPTTARNCQQFEPKLQQDRINRPR